MDIQKIFYEEIVPEASKGKIDCYFIYNILFDTYVNNQLVSLKPERDISSTIKPTLIIRDKDKFDSLLKKYVEIALTFYDETNFPKEMIDNNIPKEKVIMSLLWSNANYIDFEEPINYLEKRIEFFKNLPTEKNYSKYSELFNGRLNISVVPDVLCMETPYKLNISLENDNEKYEFPEINFGIYNDIVNIYSMQNKEKDKNSYSKKLNRLFYKIGSTDKKHLNDVTASFVVAATIALSYFKNEGYSDFSINDLLIERWNAKRIMINNLNKTKEEKIEKNNEQIRIQDNLTQKLIFTYLRLVDEFEGINTTNFPSDMNMSLDINVGNNIYSNNQFLNYIFSSIRKQEKNR